MSSAKWSTGPSEALRSRLFLLLLSLGILCLIGLCIIDIFRAHASTRAGRSTHDRRYARAMGGRLNASANDNNGNTNANTNASAANTSSNNGNNQNSASQNKDGANQNKDGSKGGDSGGGAQPVCKDVALGPGGPKTSDLVASMNKAANMTVNALGDRALLLCGPAALVDNFKGIAQRLTGGAPEHAVHETHYARLFFLRKAADIADAINKSGRLSGNVKALGDDLIIFTSESEADDDAIHEIKRWLSVVDVPRPEISLTTWSIQVSSGDVKTINEESARIRSAISGFNDRLQSALEQGWWFLEVSRRNNKDNFYAKNLSNYLSGRYLWTKTGAFNAPPPDAPQPPCWSVLSQPLSYITASTPWGADKYCLGYTRIFQPIQPSLSSMLLALIAAQPGGELSKARELRDDFVNCMEDRDICPKVLPLTDGQQQQLQRPMRPQGTAQISITGTNSAREENIGVQDAATTKQYYGRLYQFPLTSLPPVGEATTCEYNDLKLLQYQKEQGNRPGPGFSCFREQLQRSLGSGHLSEIRRVLADFLFQYKSAEYYPQDFVPWNQAASSQALDTELDPLIVAFNRDLNVYLRHIQEDVQRQHGTEKKTSFASDGIVTARVISGNAAKIETTTQSFFKQPPTLNVRDVVTALEGSPTPSLSPIAAGHGAELIAAAIKAEQRTIARVGRNLNINITSNTLRGASACEMEVSLDSAEADKPSMLNTTAGTSADDNLSRVAVHDTSTKVRVDSTKLFEVSSFAAALVHGRSIPLIPPGVDLPYIGSIARLRLPPGTVYHRSFAVVSAVIVPTAADLVNMIEFNEDLEAVPGSRLGEVQLLAHVVATPTPEPTPQQTPTPEQRGRRNRRKHPKQPTPTPEQNHQPKPPTTTAYYWIVAHYREGDSISGPFRISDAPAAKNGGVATLLLDGEHSVTLLWRAPERALSFDVIRSVADTDLSKPNGKEVLVTNLAGSSFTDDNSNPLPYKPAEYRGGRLSYVVFSRITRPASNLRAFHKAMLDCIEDEARGNTEPCTETYLSKQIPEGRGQ
jgi:hypothetical protein